jgi:YrbI family 3-deoxy-D-manno-octulosonate 8-phosphate phosphatase
MSWLDIRLILFDIDGVLTDGKAAYNEKGEVISKTYNQKDITGLRRLKNELNINVALSKRRKFPFLHVNHSKGENKSQKLNDICFDFNTPASQVGFVGDDIQDLEIMKRVGFAFCPEDAIPEIKRISCVLPVKGGEGVAAHLFEYLSNSNKL